PVVDRANEFAVDRSQQIELLRTVEEAHLLWRLWKRDALRDELARGPSRRRQLYGAIVEPRASWIECGRKEIVVVNAGKSIRAIVRRLCRDVRRRDALRASVFVVDRLRRLRVPPGEEAAARGDRTDVAEARSPQNRGIQHLAALRDVR